MPNENELRRAIQKAKEDWDRSVAFRHAYRQSAEQAELGIMSTQVAVEEEFQGSLDNARDDEAARIREGLADLRRLLEDARQEAAICDAEIGVTRLRFAALAAQLPDGDPDAQPPAGEEDDAIHRTIERMGRTVDAEIANKFGLDIAAEQGDPTAAERAESIEETIQRLRGQAEAIRRMTEPPDEPGNPRPTDPHGDDDNGPEGPGRPTGPDDDTTPSSGGAARQPSPEPDTPTQAATDPTTPPDQHPTDRPHDTPHDEPTDSHHGGPVMARRLAPHDSTDRAGLPRARQPLPTTLTTHPTTRHHPRPDSPPLDL